MRPANNYQINYVQKNNQPGNRSPPAKQHAVILRA